VRTKKLESPALSRDTVVTRALELADAEGLDAVTVRRLAQEFGVTPMALYWHFGNKEELLDAMGDALFDALPPHAYTGPWHERLRKLLDDLAAALRRHPSSAELAYRRIMACRRGQDITEAALAALADAGFPSREAAFVACQALMTVVSLVANLPGAQPGLTDDERDQHLSVKRAAIAQLPPDHYAHVISAAPYLINCEDPDEYFAFSLDLLVAGTQAMRQRVAAAG
jgi:AcrR family transcriptional regulator